MFQNVRQGSQLYIIHTSSAALYVEPGLVESSNNMPFMGYFPGANMPAYPIDVTVRIGDRVVTYQRLPASAESAEGTEQKTGEQVIVACSKDAVLGAIQELKQKSIDHLNSRAFHEQRIASCDSLYNQLNPEAAAKAAQEAEMAKMREEMARMRQQLDMLQNVKQEETSSSTKKEKS